MFANSSYVGDNIPPNPNPMRLSARVDQLVNLQVQEMRVVPVAPFVAINFESYYPLVDPGLVVNTVAVPHPTNWLGVLTFAAWDALPIGSALFTRYVGPQNGGWQHGYYLVHKR
jgi:hypothetical protein